MIQFLNAKERSTGEMLHELCKIYEHTITREGKISQFYSISITRFYKCLRCHAQKRSAGRQVDVEQIQQSSDRMKKFNKTNAS